MVCKDILRIKHLPKELTDVQKEDFVKHFGAYRVKVITSKAKGKSIVYAKFENEDVAKNVMTRLHQITILNCRLSVEYAESDLLQGQLTGAKVGRVQEGPDKRFFKTFISNINAFNESVGFYQPPPSHLKYNYPKANRATINNIAHALATVPRFYTQVLHLMNKMNLPPPFAMPDASIRDGPHVQVSKPVVTSNLVTVEKRKALSSASESELESDEEQDKRKEIIPVKRTMGKKKVVKRPKFMKQQPVVVSNAPKSVEKAENVFDKVEVQPQKKIELKVLQEPATTKVEPVKEKPKEKIETTLALKISEALNPPDEDEPKLLTPTEEKPKEVVTKSISNKLETSDKLQLYDEKDSVEVKLDIAAERAASQSTPESDKGKTVEEPVVESKETTSQPPMELTVEENKQTVVEPSTIQQEKPASAEQEEPSNDFQSSEDEFPCISLEELAANQVTDLSVIPVFKNYNPGEPTNKLYIKNCAKTVITQDLEYIYNRYREEGTHGKPSEFNIRLMQEGRMKGQAFVTLDSVEQAQKAVKETNGFILKDKPLVVVFGKAGKKK